MSQLPPPDPEPTPDDDGAYDIPEELDIEPAPARKRSRARAPEDDDGGDGEGGGARPPRPRALQIAIAVGAVLIVAIGLLWYRNHHRARVVAEGIAEAEVLLRLDTRAAFEAAFQKLDVPSRDEYDPIVARSARAFAAAMIFADYGDPAAAEQARSLLVEAERAERMPEWARLARAALALGAESKGDAMSELAEVSPGNAWANVLQARIFVAADQLDAAVEPAAAAAQDTAFVPGLAVEGDVARRARRDPAAARASYEAALAPSRAAPADQHGASPRAVFGLAKLALAGQAQPADAIRPLSAMLASKRAPSAERGRAALYLAALRLRTGDVSGAAAALDGLGLSREDRAFAGRAAGVLAEHRGPYRAIAGAPAALRSRVDDDPGVLSAAPPPPPPPPEPVVAPPPPKAKHATAKRGSTKPVKATAKKTPKKPAAKKPAPKRTTATR